MRDRESWREREGRKERQGEGGEKEGEREREINSLCHLYDVVPQPFWEPVVSPWASCWGDS